MPSPSIVQIEFFLDSARTLPELTRKLRERIQDGSPIKTVVRYYDTEGHVAPAVSRVMAARDVHDQLREWFFQARHFKRFWAWRADRAHAKLHSEQARAAALAIAALRKAIAKRYLLAIEVPLHRFRYMEENELHEIDEIAGNKDRRIWLFVFPHNHLLADSHDQMLSMM